MLQLTKEQFDEMGIHIGDMRISIGLETADVLIEYLNKCLS